ncbi:MAG: hypothetical protein Kow001_07900 [Acidobacteriota bacterium]
MLQPPALSFDPVAENEAGQVLADPGTQEDPAGFTGGSQGPCSQHFPGVSAPYLPLDLLAGFQFPAFPAGSDRHFCGGRVHAAILVQSETGITAPPGMGTGGGWCDNGFHPSFQE